MVGRGRRAVGVRGAFSLVSPLPGGLGGSAAPCSSVTEAALSDSLRASLLPNQHMLGGLRLLGLLCLALMLPSLWNPLSHRCPGCSDIGYPLTLWKHLLGVLCLPESGRLCWRTLSPISSLRAACTPWAEGLGICLHSTVLWPWGISNPHIPLSVLPLPPPAGSPLPRPQSHQFNPLKSFPGLFPPFLPAPPQPVRPGLASPPCPTAGGSPVGPAPHPTGTLEEPSPSRAPCPRGGRAASLQRDHQPLVPH